MARDQYQTVNERADLGSGRFLTSRAVLMRETAAEETGAGPVSATGNGARP